jgi:hypothetical protein
MIKAAIHKSFRLFGLDIIHFPTRERESLPDFRSDEADIIRQVRPWTMTGPERIYALTASKKRAKRLPVPEM